jgi:adenylate kinase family enzyme
VVRGIGRRIIVIGSPNAGKSTLAQRLAGRLRVPFIELDALHWEPGWVAAERDVFRERVRRAIAPASWVLAGNYTRQQQDVSWPVADTVVWLDLGLPTVLHRCVVRCWRRWRSPELLWGTNREVFWEHLLLWDPERSLIAYTLTTHRARRRRFEAYAREPRWSHLTFIRLRSVEEIDRWLAGIPAQPTCTIKSQGTSAQRGAGES